MVKNKFILVFLFALGNAFLAYGQENRFMLFFSDKNHSVYSIDRPEEFLSQRAIERRANQHIDITPEDLPVSAAYLDSLKERNIKYYHQTKWMNGVLIEVDSALLPGLQKASFVDTIMYIAPGAKLKNPYDFSPPVSNMDEGNMQREIKPEDHVALPQNKMMEVGAMHKEGYMGEGMLIGVFDGGFENVDKVEGFRHLFDENRILATKNFVANDDSVYQYSNHGTHALSCIAGFIPDKFIGTAPNASFLLCVTEDVQGEYRIEEYNWLFAAEFADSLGVDVINTSLGYNTFSDASMNYTYEEFDGKTTVITRAASIAAKKGIVLVTSAGNEGNNEWKYISAPADADSVLAVGAVDLNLKKAFFSSLGPTADGRLKPEVSAFGSDVVVINRSGNLATARGTSFSAPLMTGVVAGFWQANPELTAQQVIARVRLAGHKAAAPNNELGYGVPSFDRAMSGEILGVRNVRLESFAVYPNPIINGRLYLQPKASGTSQEREIYLYNSTGTLVKQINIPPGKGLHGPFVFDFSDVAPGIYIINMVSRNTSEAVKVVNF